MPSQMLSADHRFLVGAAWARAAAAALAAERGRWFLWSPVLLGLGIAGYFALPLEPAVWLGPAASACLGLGAWLLRDRTVAAPLTLVLLLLAFGFALASLRTATVAAPVLQKRLGPVWVSGRVVAATVHGDGWRLTLEASRIDRQSPAEKPERVRISVASVPEAGIAVGDQVRLLAILMPPPAPAAPGAFDFARQAWFERLGAVGFAVGTAEVLPDEAAWGPRVTLGRVRQALSARIRDALPGTSGAIAAALMTGDRGAIPESTWAAMRGSGLAHLLAISGLHIGLVASLLYFGLRGALAGVERLALRRPIKKWAALAAALGAFAYLELTGATVPTQRSFLMVALVLLAILTERSALSMRTVAWAALAILALAPESLLSVSFQMSFAAVVALIATYEALGPRFAAWRRQAGWARRGLLYLAGVAVTTVVAGTATMPFAAYHFSEVTHYGLAANLLAVPLMALWIMPWAVVAYMAAPLGLDGLALAPMGWGIEAMLAIAETVAGWPGAVSRLPAPPAVALALIGLGGLWLCLWRLRWRWVGVAVVALGVGLGLSARPPDLLIDGDGRLAAVRLAEGGLDFTRDADGYRSQSWLRRVGAFAPASDGFACDRLGCVAVRSGRTVAYVADERALAEDCRRADIVLSAVPIRPRCPSAGLVVDRFDLWREGAHAVWLSGEGMEVRTAAEFRGDRPWSPTRGRARWRRLIAAQ